MQASLNTYRLWAKRMAIVGGVISAISLSPFIPALLGLALNNAELQTYHWLLLITVPFGLPLGGLSFLVAFVLWVMAKRQERKTS